jgi:predicted nucleic acid-binding protein
MIVIADTTPLNHVVLLEKAAILQRLYGRVIVPAAVLAELTALATKPQFLLSLFCGSNDLQSWNAMKVRGHCG